MLTFTLISDTFLSIQLLNVQGQIVQTINDQVFSKGVHQLIFSPHHQLQSGVYWIQFQSPYYNQTIPTRIL